MHTTEEQIQRQIEQERNARETIEKAINEKGPEVKQAQQLLKQWNEKLEAALPANVKELKSIAKFASENPNPVLRFSFYGKLLFSNEAGKKILATYPGNGENHFWMPFLQNKQLQQNKFEIEITVAENTFLLLFSPQAELGYVNIFGRNITEIKTAQVQLIKNETRYRQLIENGNTIFYTLSDSGCFTYVNTTLSRLSGYNKEELLAMRFSDLIHEDYKKAVTAFYLNQFATHISSTYQEFPLITKQGDELWIGQNCSISMQNDGKLELIAVSRDITEKINSNKQLTTTTVRLSALIDNLLDGVMVADEHEKVVLINHSFCELLSIPVSPSALAGKDCSAITKKIERLFDSPKEFSENIHALTIAKKMYVGEHLQLADGRVYERDCIPIFSENGYLGSLWQYRDVTEKNKIQNSILLNEEKYRGIIENMELGLLEVDKNDKILAANEQFCKIAGYSSSIKLIGKPATETFLDIESQKIMREQNERRTEGNTGLYEVKIKKPDDQGFSWVLICGAPLFDDSRNVIGSIGIHLDISDQKKIEAALSIAKTKAEASSRAKETFLANMSHEIRTPMNAIIGMSELLNDTPLESKQKQYIDAIRTSSNNLLTIINDILDFSKIESGELALQQTHFSLKNIATHVINALSYKAVEKSIILNAEIDPKIQDQLLGDPIRLNQILLNLISNSIKYTQEGTVNLTCKLVEDTLQYTAIEFKVTDTGIGIDPIKLEAIFESFNQAEENLSRKYTSSGLGLTICKQLIALMGGEIVVESKKNIGSIFLFTLKFKKESNAMSMENTGTTEEKNLSRIKLLLVEDNQINQLLATTILRKWKAEVEVAVNGIHAIEALKKNKYDIILMDIQMPEMGGIEATQLIRSELKITTPIIAVTANALKGDRETYLEAGMDDYISKPFEQDVLYSKIKKYLDVSGPEKNETNEPINTKSMEPAQQLYDLTEIRKISGGDSAFIKQMITIFLDQIPQSLTQINQAIEIKNYDRIKGVAHQMKPSIDIMQIESLKKEVRFVEENAGNLTNLEQLPTYITKLNTVLNGVLEQLKNDPEYKNG